MYRRYGVSAIRPEGYPEDPARCVARVWRDYASAQCRRRRGHGPGAEYCRQHGREAEAVAARKAERERERREAAAERRERDRERARELRRKEDALVSGLTAGKAS